MSLKLYSPNGDSGWFEPEESRKKRDNGWVTDPALLESPKEEEPNTNLLPETGKPVVNEEPDETINENIDVTEGGPKDDTSSDADPADEIVEKELDKPEETKTAKKEIKKTKKSRKKPTKKV